MAQFTVDVTSFESIGTEQYGEPYAKSFNGDWCEFIPVTNDPIKASAGIESAIIYYAGGATANATTYYVGETVEELVALANGGA
jgi:hypothetical protein